MGCRWTQAGCTDAGTTRNRRRYEPREEDIRVFWSFGAGLFLANYVCRYLALGSTCRARSLEIDREHRTESERRLSRG